MATTTQPHVLDLMLAKVNGLLPFGIPQNSDQVYVVDGSPGPNKPPFAVFVMPLPDDQSRGTEEWEDSTKARIENYDMLLHIWRYVGGGPEANTLSTAQKRARDDASLVEAAIEQAFLVDVNLRIQNGGSVAPIVQMGLSNVNYSQTNPDEDDGKGRFAQYDMTYHVYNYLPGPGPS